MSMRGMVEFRALFGQEAEIRLTRLGQLVLELERVGATEAVVASIFREVHTLKGAAAVVGFDDVSRFAHDLEEQLEALRSGHRAVSPELVDELLQGVDALTALTRRSVDGDGLPGAPATLEEALRSPFSNRPMESALLEADPQDGTADDVSRVVAAPVEPLPVGSAPVGSAPVGSAPVGSAPVDPLPPAPADLVGGNRTAMAPRGLTPLPTPKGQRASPAAREGGGAVMVPLDRLDELVRLVGEAAAAHLRVGRVVSERLGVEPGSIAEFGELSRVLNDLQERAMRARMVPVATITDQLHRAVRDVARALHKEVRWEVRGEDTELDRGVLHELADSLLHLVRNAVDHGVETPDEREAAGKPRVATVRLHAMQLGSEVIIAVTDDGRGIDVDRVRQQAARQGVDVDSVSDDDALQLIFRSGLSTSRFVSDISGRGVGLDVVRASVEVARGRIEVRSERGKGTEFRVVVPITLAVLPCLLVIAGGQRFALPLHRVVLAQADNSASQSHAEGRRVIWVDRQPVAVSALAETLGLAGSDKPAGPVVVLSGTLERHAFKVDTLVGQREVVVKGLSPLHPRLDVIAGASVDPDGTILLVLDPPGLVDRARQTGTRSSIPPAPEEAMVARHGSILVVDDALTIRELQRSILERAGYEVRVAADGLEALGRLAEEPSDLVMTDIEMPRMDGFALTEAIRARPALANIAVLILTSRSSDEDRQRGLEAGADGYIVKSAFDERSLLSAVDRLLGSRV